MYKLNVWFYAKTIKASMKLTNSQQNKKRQHSKLENLSTSEVSET